MDFNEGNEQALSALSALQVRERELHSMLEDKNLTSQERQLLIDEMNSLSQSRANIYDQLKDIYDSYRDNIYNLDSSIDFQIDTISTMENQLNQSKIYLNSVDQLKLDKLRVTEINNYYAKRYNAYKNIMFVISISCIPILALTILNNNSVIPSFIYQIVISLIVLVASYIAFNQYLDISNRDNLNWDNYSWHFNKNDAPKPGTSNEDDYDDSEDEDEDDICVGDQCCGDGFIYDSSLNQCVLSTSVA